MGLSRAQGGRENPPVFHSQLPPTDFTAGALGALGTILALFTRARTGIVQRVDTNLLNGGIVLSSEWFTRYRGQPWRRLADQGQYGLEAGHRLYAVHDGWLYVAAHTPDIRHALCRALNVEDQLDTSNDAVIAQTLSQRLAQLSLADSMGRLKGAGVPCAPVVEGHSEHFLRDPQAVANDLVATYQHPVLGQMQVAHHFVHFSHTTVLQGRPTPLLGEQTREMLRDAGFRDDAISALHAKGIVKTEEPAAGG